MATKKTTQTTPQSTPDGKNVLVNVVLDRSGSMSTSRAETITGYNSYVDGLKADKDTKYSLTLIQFDSHAGGPELLVSYADKPLSEVPVLTEAGYEPRGYTPLYDAIGECVRRVEPNGRVVINVIITDGHENASKEFTNFTVKDLIKKKEAEGWTFVFLGANIDSYAVSSSLGMSAANTANYAQGNEQKLYSNLARSTMVRSAEVRASGLMHANTLAFVDDQQRADILDKGGRPAAPPPFPTGKPAPQFVPAARSKSTKWAVCTGVPNS